MTGLTEHTAYWIRAFATNSAGTGYGGLIIFNTPLASAENGIVVNPNLTYGSVTDIDGNVYKTIQIGTQTWMAENLKTTHYRNGDTIPNTTDDTAWWNLNTGAYCWCNNNAATYKANYGALYNWSAVNDSRNLAPTGWHIPSDAEWTTLTTILGDGSVAGGKLKETGITHWFGPNQGATNETGFTALPGGDRGLWGNWNNNISTYGSWWSSTGNPNSAGEAFHRNMHYAGSDVARYSSYKVYGLSVRCLKN